MQTVISSRIPRWIRAIFVANLIAQSAIIVTGAVVRLTGSGLGCPTWPQCVEGSYTPTARQEEAFHKYIEFGNRLLTFALVIIAIAVLLAVFINVRSRRRAGIPQRPAIIVLGVIPFVGTAVQAVLGGVTVLTGLHPLIVSAHFLLSMVLVTAAVVLVARSGDLGDQPVVHLAPSPVRFLTWLMVSVAALVVVLGVITTGSGPHSGDAQSEARFSFDPQTVAWLHADTVFLFIGLLIGLLISLMLFSSTGSMRKRTLLLIGVTITQGGIGYVQYFTGLPSALVAVHVGGAVLTWIAVLFIPFSMRIRAEVPAPTIPSSIPNDLGKEWRDANK
ncbi:MAG: heme A synthase [Actinomycetales bacterium]|nr:heme A synthase [Actinomycetales bacterium]